jgi:hypothetical protein
LGKARSNLNTVKAASCQCRTGFRDWHPGLTNSIRAEEADLPDVDRSRRAYVSRRTLVPRAPEGGRASSEPGVRFKGRRRAGQDRFGSSGVLLLRGECSSRIFSQAGHVFSLILVEQSPDLILSQDASCDEHVGDFADEVFASALAVAEHANFHGIA